MTDSPPSVSKTLASHIGFPSGPGVDQETLKNSLKNLHVATGCVTLLFSSCAEDSMEKSGRNTASGTLKDVGNKSHNS